jgi:hypothetical protein
MVILNFTKGKCMKRIFTFTLLVVILLGCGMKPLPPKPWIDNTNSNDENAVNARGGRAGANLSSTSNERLVISSATIFIESLEPDSVHSWVIDMATKYNGYVLSAEKGTTSIRIPATGFRDAVKEIELMGKVKNENITGQDVTEDYKDYQVRLDNAEKSRQRYLALLDKAQNVDEILQVEKELERLNNDIELVKGKLDRLSHLIQYSTITVKTADEIRPGPLGYIFYGLYAGIKWLFVWD